MGVEENMCQGEMTEESSIITSEQGSQITIWFGSVSVQAPFCFLQFMDAYTRVGSHKVMVGCSYHFTTDIEILEANTDELSIFTSLQ